MVDSSKLLRRLWTDTCTVTNMQEVEDENDHSTSTKEVTVLKDEPCKLSFQTLSTTAKDGVKAELVQKAKLFLTNEVEIKAGSSITVKRGKRVFEYSSSGLPAIFSSHQEIVLEPKERYS